ncbi:glycerate kinase [Psychrobacter sp. FDAARGOS_221]|uniref:glycerate kinase n=1 Tax=Psychrobacter sp. FDAARGOS_221 TaxID=1975705 RepID=UPI000BB57FFD|nr:glycerate kinase [Psychrobacter sp. FDAARGOS_221]PNK59536.1 glycerate kinase [Psychrobacter sp. FDAARGOS_221]
MNILIAPDSFKESLNAIEVCNAIKEGFSQVYPNAEYHLLPLADGGEGTSSVLSYVLDGEWQQIKVHDPLMRPVTAKYFLTHDGMAIIEVAEACGLHLLASAERNPLITTTYGVGEMIADAIGKGAIRLLIGLGGSATNDAGAGMLQALGVRIFDTNGNLLSAGGANLIDTHSIDASPLKDLLSTIKIAVACDVTSPLCGPTGASHVFGPQKGATSADDILTLDQALAHFAAVTDSAAFSLTGTHNIKPNCADVEGAGAAGGLGFALMAYCQAGLKSGFDTISEVVQLDQHLASADLVITGEGKLDAQTAMGKVASGVALRAKAINPSLPVIAICGSVDRDLSAQNRFNNLPFDVVMPSIQKPDALENILAGAYPNVAQTAYQLAAALQLGQRLNPE